MTASTSSLLARLRNITISARLLILLTATFIIVANNGALFRALGSKLEILSVGGATFVFSAYLLLITVLSIAFFIAGHPYTLKPVLIFFIGLSAVLSYFSQQLGVVFDVDMIRNVAETIRDNNQQEAFELLSFALLLHLFFYGLLPSLIIVVVKPVYEKPLPELLKRTGYVAAMLAVVGLTVWANFKFTSFFVRENREIRVYTIPTYPIFALQQYAKKLRKSEAVPFETIGLDAVQEKQSPKRTIGVMVVGETARADHFSLNGYDRLTNPILSQESLLNFSNVTAAGTSTAYSVPSMFTFMKPNKFTPEKAASVSNVLDVLKKAGVDVFWIENNSSSKGVANRIETLDLRKAPDPTDPLYSDGGYYDEALVNYFDECVANATGDVLLILHTMGSHGPTYHKRYPPDHAQFVPDCKSSSPQECSSEEVINAYDNTILYTDFVLGGLIDYLKARGEQDDTFLLYASDHGESLGEDGVYLHGLPKFLAPEAQTHVPMLAWVSQGYAASHNMPKAALGATVDQPLTHENIPHSLLSLMGVKTELYLNEFDLFAPYRETAQ